MAIQGLYSTLRNLLAISVLVSWVLGVSACSLFVPKSPINTYPFQLLLQAEDVPSGWAKGKIRGRDLAGGMSFEVVFGRTNDVREAITIGHELAVLPDEASAQTVYADWEDEWFPNVAEWYTPSEITFLPQAAQDQYRVACIDGLVDAHITSCTYLQKHHTLVSLILVNLDQAAYTWTDFERTLQALDSRFQAYAPAATTEP